MVRSVRKGSGIENHIEVIVDLPRHMNIATLRVAYFAQADVGAVIEVPDEGAFDRLRRGRYPYYVGNRRGGSDVDHVFRSTKALSGVHVPDDAWFGRCYRAWINADLRVAERVELPSRNRRTREKPPRNRVS